jgi:hypothetical protein
MYSRYLKEGDDSAVNPKVNFKSNFPVNRTLPLLDFLKVISQICDMMD